MLKRKIFKYLANFFKKERKALLLTGARQVGKTFAIRKIGSECFDVVVVLNFIEKPEYVKIFEQPRNAKEILLRISALTEQELIPGKTLIFFDEVQECPEIVTAIKFLVDEGSYNYVMSGSLLGIEMKDIRSVPVGYMVVKEMFPLDFEEFCDAVGMSKEVMEHLRGCYENDSPVDEVVHNKMLDLLKLYLVVGGMPSVVVKYLQTNNMKSVRDEQQVIINAYKMDIAKYDSENKLYIKDIFDMIPSELNAKNKRFILKSLNENAKFDRYRNSFLWLSDAGVALPTYNVEEPRMPFRLAEQRNLFKLFSNDVGLLACQYAAGFQLQIVTGQLNVNFGAIFENFAAQQLKANGFELHYFNSKKQGELDFVVECDGKVMPLEIKSGKDYKRHNALGNVLNNDEYDIETAIVFSLGNVERNGKIRYLPIYMLMYLLPTEIPDSVFRFQPI
ncbi:MAG: ATP-binding protein [Bacteroidales bacterium]|nr:ATP-binding protein [Bacteroidales bacterium]